MNRLSSLPSLLLATLLAASLPVSAAHHEAEEVRATLDRAAEIHGEAVALEHGWSVTEPFMDEAEAALAAGNIAQARELAQRALLTAEKSLEQAQVEADNWAARVVRR